MNSEAQQLIHGFLDDSLTAEQHDALGHWIRSDSSHARHFVAEVMLHDRLSNELAIMERGAGSVELPAEVSLHSPLARSLFALAATVCLLLLAAFILWQSLGVHPVSAAGVELDRIIAVSAQSADRTYQIAVEELALPPQPGERPAPPDRGRPPKPPMDGAVLHVRGERLFVLVRTTTDGLPFVTGSNGLTSWAVRPDDPVRVSADLTCFSRDLPGHEHAMPLSNLQDGLERLREAYDVRLLPIESQEEDASRKVEPSRLLVAVKKLGYRGPKRVEITYAVHSGHIRQMRFVEMPYGPERLTLRMTLVEERNLGADFFDHETHHDAKRVVEFEE